MLVLVDEFVYDEFVDVDGQDHDVEGLAICMGVPNIFASSFALSVIRPVPVLLPSFSLFVVP